MGHHARRPPRRRGDLVRAAALLTAAGVAAAMTFPAAAGSSVAPRPAVRLPAAAEALSSYLPQVSCDPAPKPGVSAFRALMLTTYHRGSDGGIARSCADGGPSEHKEGRAWDWMLDLRNPADRAAGTAAVTFLLSPGPHGEIAWNARRMGVMYIIWNRHIWGSYQPGWRAYDGPNPHTDHIHFTFDWAGALKHTSWWTGRVAVPDFGPCQTMVGTLAPAYRALNVTPCPAPVPAVVGAYAAPGNVGSRVVLVQRALRVLPQSGFYGVITTRAVAAFQHRHAGLTATGVVDQRTAVALGLVRPPAPPVARVQPTAVFLRVGSRGPAVVALQRALRVTPTSGLFGAHTFAAVRLYQHRIHHPSTGVLTMAEGTALRLPGVPPLLVAAPAAPAVYAKPGDRGARVVAVQRALRIRPISGFYGPVTQRAVLAFQGRHRGLHPTGVVDLATARALSVIR